MKQFTQNQPFHQPFFYLIATCILLMTPACTKQAGDTEMPANPELTARQTSVQIPATMLQWYDGLNATTLWELQQARAATARYRNIENAKKDGYADINVVMENMGHHFMKASNLDDQFDMRNPEILVYNKMSDGTMELVAVEYAIPIDLSPNAAPEGFTGSSDVWSKNTGFGLWLLHAWVWYPNPDGVFNPTNKNVHTH